MTIEDNDGDDSVRDINSGQPFHRMALKYMDNGFMPIPLKAHSKEPYGTGLTGNKNKMPMGDERRDKIVELLGTVAKGANIGLWLHPEVIGIDVDNYPDGEKEKKGAVTLERLESRYGELPDTWISTARSDGVSGIRLYRIPVGLQWSGKAGDDIDIIQTGHRYAACYPSYHPSTKGMYQWYSPGAPLNGIPERPMAQVTVGNVTKFEPVVGEPMPIPNADDLPELPSAWVTFLTRGNIKATVKPIDMDSTGRDIEAWAKKHFRSGKARTDDSPPRRMCKQVRNRLAKATASIASDASSHDKIVNGHWSLLNCGLEGHFGVLNAAKDLEKLYVDNTVRDRGKRGAEEVRREVFRSRIEALRKIKGLADQIAETGADPFGQPCACFDPSDTPKGTAQASLDPTGAEHDPSEYALTDDGNAEHLRDLYKDYLVWVPAWKKWLYWTGDQWIADAEGVARRCYWTVRDRQQAYADQLWDRLNNMSGDKDDYDREKAKAAKWAAQARSSGNYRTVTNALESAKSIEGMSIAAEVFDSNGNLLGVNNGAVELLEGDGGYRFRPAKHDDYVTVRTNVDWVSIVDQIKAGGDSAKGVELWIDYLDRFIPDMELRHFVQKAMGYCLLGSNPERLTIFLMGTTSTGKSTFLNAIMSALGEYTMTVDLGIFKEQHLNPMLAQALSRRVITSNEVSSHNYLHADVVKRATGNNPISAERKYSNVIETRIPAFTPVIATNSPPTIKGADLALQKRLLIIPFNQQVSAKDDNVYANSNLDKYSAQAVLSWLIEGWVMYAREGLDRAKWPSVVMNTTEDFAGELSEIGQFLQEAVKKINFGVVGVKSKQPHVTVQAMFEAYRAWSLQQMMTERDILSKNPFGKQLGALGIKSEGIKIDGRVVRVYLGYKVESNGLNIKTTSK